MHKVKPLLGTSVLYIEVPGLGSSYPASDPAVCYYNRKVEDDGPTTWVPAIHVGDTDGIMGSWLQPRLAFSVGEFQGEPMEGRSLSFCLFLGLCHTAFQINE